VVPGTAYLDLLPGNEEAVLPIFDRALARELYDAVPIPRLPSIAWPRKRSTISPNMSGPAR
jgi:hypothetical protein